MAPELKTSGSPAPRRVLLNTGAAPQKRVRLLGANGQAIEAKKSASTLKNAAPSAEDAEAQAAAAAAKAAEEAAAAQAAAEAQAEYERQMEEYNRQMEEYNRAQAELKAKEEAEAKAQAEAEARARAEAEAKAQAEAEARAQAAAKIAEAEAALKAAQAEARALQGGETPVPSHTAPAKPALKLATAKPVLSKASPAAATAAGAPKPALAKPALAVKKPAGAAPKPAMAVPHPAGQPAPEATESETSPAAASMSEEEQAARDAYLQNLQKQAEAKPIWKKPIFMVACGVLLLGGAYSAYHVHTENAKTERINKHRDYVRSLMHTAEDINKKHINTLADAKAKSVDIKCSAKDAKVLLEVVVDPFIKTEAGSNLLGNAPVNVAYNACVLLGIAAEQTPEIADQVFKVLESKASKIDPRLYRFQLQRMALANVPDINGKLAALSEKVSKLKPWPKKSQILSHIWETMGLRVAEKDVDSIVDLLNKEDTEPVLANTLISCLDNVQEMMPKDANKTALGDKIFDKVSETYRDKCVHIFAKCRSPKALAYYKGKLADTANWKNKNNLVIVSDWGNDDLIPYALELCEKAKGNKTLEANTKAMIGSLLLKNYERKPEDVEKLIALYVPNASADSSQLQDILVKVDKDSPDFIGESAPEYKELMKQKNDLEQLRKDKLSLIKLFSTLVESQWLDGVLNKYVQDADIDVSVAAKEALQKVKENKQKDDEKRAQYNSRQQ